MQNSNLATQIGMAPSMGSLEVDNLPDSTDAASTASTTTAASVSDAGTTTPSGTTTSTESARGPRKYERRSKRFVWPEDLHRLFVAAIFDLGLKNASPKALLPFMGTAAVNAGITTEHLKSRLQKYRLNYERSRQEFLRFYDEAARANQRRRLRAGNNPNSNRMPPDAAGDMSTMGVFPVRPKHSFSIRPGSTAQPSVGSSSADGDMSDTDPDMIDQSPQLGYLPVPPDMHLNQFPPHQGMPPTYGNMPSPMPSPGDASAADLLMLAQQYAAAAAALGYPNGQMMGNPAAQWPLLASLLASQLAAQGQQQQQHMQDPNVASANMTQIHQAMQANMSLHRQMLSQLNVVSQNAIGSNVVSPPTPDRPAPGSFTASLTGADWNPQQYAAQAQAQAQAQAGRAQHGMSVPMNPAAGFNAPPQGIDPNEARARPRPTADARGVMDFLSSAPNDSDALTNTSLDLYRGDGMDMDLSDDDGDLFDFLRA